MFHVGVCVVISCLSIVALWSPAGKGLTSLLWCVLCFVTPGPHQNQGRGRRRESGLTPFKTVIILWIICVFFVSCVLDAFASVHCCLVVTCWERADLLAHFGDVLCILLLYHVVSWVRCGT